MPQVVLGILIIIVVSLATASLRRTGKISAHVQTVLLGLVIACVLVAFMLQWWGSVAGAA